MPLRRLDSYVPRPQRQGFHYEYDGRDINYNLWITSNDRHVRTIIFLGTVQIGKLPFWIAQQCPPGTVVVQGAPHWLAKDDGSDIPDFIDRFTREVFTSILSKYKIKKLRVIADSQAAPGVIGWQAKNDRIIVVDQLVLLQPLGLNADAFKGSREERVRLFKKRIAKNFRYQLSSLLSDRRLVYNHGQILKKIGYDNPKSNAQYSSGLMHDATEDLKKITAMRTQIVVICGENDMMFPAQEIKDTIRKNQLNIPVIVIPKVPHSPLATRRGMRLLSQAFEYFETDRNHTRTD